MMAHPRYHSRPRSHSLTKPFQHKARHSALRLATHSGGCSHSCLHCSRHLVGSGSSGQTGLSGPTPEWVQDEIWIRGLGEMGMKAEKWPPVLEDFRQSLRWGYLALVSQEAGFNPILASCILANLRTHQAAPVAAHTQSPHRHSSTRPHRLSQGKSQPQLKPTSIAGGQTGSSGRTAGGESTVCAQPQPTPGLLRAGKGCWGHDHLPNTGQKLPKEDFLFSSFYGDITNM